MSAAYLCKREAVRGVERLSACGPLPDGHGPVGVPQSGHNKGFVS